MKHVILYSDCCSGQNRNQYLAAGLHHTVKASPSLEILEQKFLESGHTQMECDSMHSAIEHAKKGTSIYHPDQWDTVIHMARRNKPYVVVPMRYNNFKDLKSFTKEEYSGMKTDTEGNKVNWMRIKVIRVTKESPDEIQIKESFTDQQFRSIRIRQTRGRPSDTPKAIPNKYDSRLPITVQKKKDLMSLCDSLIIPEHYRCFYEGLKTSTTMKDRLPEPDILEEEDDSD